MRLAAESDGPRRPQLMVVHDRPSTIREFARKAVSARMAEIGEKLRAAVKNPADEEAVHGLRVNIRRATAALQAFDQFFDPKKLKRLRKKLRELARACGRVRDCDVVLDLLKEAGMRGGKGSHDVKERRDVRRGKLRDELKKWQSRSIVSRWAGSPPEIEGQGGPWNPTLSLSANAALQIPKQLAETYAVGDSASGTGSLDYQQLHEFRLKVKETRYLLELLANPELPAVKKIVETLRKLQSELGAISDCNTAADLLHGFEQAEKQVSKLLAKRVGLLRGFWRRHCNAAWLERSLSTLRDEGSYAAKTR